MSHTPRLDPAQVDTAHVDTAPTPTPTEPLSGSNQQIARAVALVLLLMAWEHTYDLISRRFGLYDLTFASPAKLGMAALTILVSVGGIVALGCVRLGNTTWRSLGWRFEHLGKLIGLGLAQTAILVGLVFGAYFALAGVKGVAGLAAAIATMPTGHRIFYLVMGTKVAILEETLFRGDLLGRLHARFGPIIAIVLSSVLFALFHRTLAPVPLGMKFVFGVVFCLFTLKSRSLLPSMIGHLLLWVIVGNN